MNELLTIEMVGEALSLSPWTVRHFIRTGRLKRIKVGRRVMVEKNELEQFLQSCRERE